MAKKIFLLFLSILFITIALIFNCNDKMYKVKKIESPIRINLGKVEFQLKGYDCFDSKFTDKNKNLANHLNITEEEAFILGNLGKYWTEGILKGRFVYLNNSDLIYLKISYTEKFKYSGFCLKNDQVCYKDGFEKRLKDIRHTEYLVLDLDSDIVYNVSSPEVRNLKRYLVIKRVHLPKCLIKKAPDAKIVPAAIINTTSTGNIKLFVTDFTTKLKPDRKCDSLICKEILTNINNAKESIDIAIYGYSRTPEIENALISASKRGVKIRLVIDSDQKGENIYPDTDIIKKILPDNISDINSAEVQNIMHNKFYIFDNKILITGSANLSHTDMSDFNSNSMIVIESPEAAKIYKQEFEEMFGGKFHNDKILHKNKNIKIDNTELQIYFSPQDKSITNAVIPLINKAEKYIYIPTFVLTDKKLTSALISAQQRGVDIKIIIDALNASVKHSKHRELRNGGILVKTENYAGKMHSKSMIIDDKYTIIGSMNFSYSGENKNDENLIIINDSNIARSYRDFFMRQWNKIDDKWLKYNARAEGKDSIGSCSDGLDNNYDGLTDMEDPACR